MTWFQNEKKHTWYKLMLTTEDTIDSPSKSKPLEAKKPPTGRTIIPMENMNSTLYAFMTGPLRAGAIGRRRFCQDVEYEYSSGDDDHVANNSGV